MTAKFTRRSLILQGLAGITVVAAGGLAWRAWDKGVFSVGQGPAYEPWYQWREARESGPLAMVQAGILAANAHNTQPWRFAIASDRVSLYADPNRNIGTFDPYRREMHLSLGCALENMLLAARAQGFEPKLEVTQGRFTPVVPEGPVAVLHFASRQRERSDLFDAISMRNTYRGPYRPDRPLSAQLETELQNLAADFSSLRLFLFADEVERRPLGDLVVSATEAIVADRAMAADSARWFRFDWEEVQRNRDGITLDAVGLPPFINAAAKILPPISVEEADRTWLKDTREVHVATAPLLGLIGVSDLYDRPSALDAGRLWQRIHLWATARGLVAQPLSQPAEMVDRERQLNAPARMADALATFSGGSTWRPTFVFRMGYSDRAPRLSPRRPIEDVLIK